MQKVYALHNEDFRVEYDQNGFYMTELLPDTYNGGIRNFKCFLKAGSEYKPELQAKETVLLMFGKGKGYIASKKHLFNITEVAVYAADFDKESYTIHALEDMEFVCSRIEMNEWDWKVFNSSHVRLPFFVQMSDCVIYDQDCKGPHTDSWWILSPQQLGRIMLGIVRANGEGTVEKGHPKVEQWNYCLGNSDFHLSVEDAPVVHHKGGEWSYVPAGYDHSLTAEPGKEVFYFWYEHYTREKDFVVCPLPGEEWVDDGEF